MDYKIIYPILIYFIFIGITVMFFWKLAKHSSVLNDELNAIKLKAQQAFKEEELQSVWEELKEVNKKCWHHTFGARVLEIKSILETKYSMLKKAGV
jgi:hypothetical protein